MRPFTLAHIGAYHEHAVGAYQALNLSLRTDAYFPSLHARGGEHFVKPGRKSVLSLVKENPVSEIKGIKDFKIK